MSSAGSQHFATPSAHPALALRAEAVRDRVRAQAGIHNREDLVAVLDDIPDITVDDPVRVIVAGSLKRGKSTLVNTLVGRPLLSPVGIDVTTACWVEIGYGDEQATALIASAISPGQPTRRPIDVTEVERYVALDRVSEPVIGVEIRVPSSLLKDMMLVDTPGVGGLNSGHSQITLAALKQADALLFVSDCTQPILAPEVDFLASAAERVATVIVAITKSDTPGCEVVVSETRERLARRKELTGVPVLAVSPPLADQASGVGDQGLAAQLAELSGLAPLMATMRERSAVGRSALRIANCAQTTANVARALARHLDELATDPLGARGRIQRLEREEAQLAAVQADQSILSVVIASHLLRLRTEPQDSFTRSVAALRQRYRDEAQQGPAAQLATLAARITADLTAAGVASLDLATDQSEHLVRTILERIGASDIAADLPVQMSAGFDLGLGEPDAKANPRGLAVAGRLFPTLVKLIGGSAVVVSVLTGPGAVAASVALAACAGWWRTWSGSEHERRSQLRSWVDSAVDQAGATFNAEMARRVTAVQAYLDSVLPALLDARRADLERVRRELTDTRTANTTAQHEVYGRLVEARDLLYALADEAIDITRTVTTAQAGDEH